MFGFLQKYPPSIYFIFGAVFALHAAIFAFTGIYIPFLNVALEYDETDSMIIYHSITSLGFLTSIGGAAIADSWLGQYKTILYSLFLYMISISILVVVTLGATWSSVELVPILYVRMIAIMVLISRRFALGGILTNFPAFGATQLHQGDEAEYNKKISWYFSLTFIAQNLGIVAGGLAGPKLKAQSCWDTARCFPLAFTFALFFAILSTVIFRAGFKSYITVESRGESIRSQVYECIWYAAVNKFKKRNERKRDHWLDYADDRFTPQFIEDTKSLLNLLTVYIPLPIFWSLFSQQQSRFIFQSVRMDGSIFNDMVVIEPDQMEVFNAVAVMIFLPIFNYGIYPLLGKFHILKSPFHRMTVGMMLAAVAYGITMLVENELYLATTKLPDLGMADVMIFNTANCSVELHTDMRNLTKFTIEKHSMWKQFVKHKREGYSVKVMSNCTVPQTTAGHLTTNEKKPQIHLISGRDLSFTNANDTFRSFSKSKIGSAKIGFIHDLPPHPRGNLRICLMDRSGYKSRVTLKENSSFTDFIEPSSNSRYSLSIHGNDSGLHVTLRRGGVYIMTLRKEENEYKINRYTLTPSNRVSILWQLPQNMILVMADILFSVTGLQFSFQQAPHSMKLLVQGWWMAAMGLGNMIVICLIKLQFKDQSIQKRLSLYFVIMLINTCSFVVITWKYKPRKPLDCAVVEDSEENDFTQIQ